LGPVFSPPIIRVLDVIELGDLKSRHAASAFLHKFELVVGLRMAHDLGAIFVCSLSATL
jgi:hypothetical protein